MAKNRIFLLNIQNGVAQCLKASSKIDLGFGI